MEKKSISAIFSQSRKSQSISRTTPLQRRCAFLATRAINIGPSRPRNATRASSATLSPPKGSIHWPSLAQHLLIKKRADLFMSAKHLQLSKPSANRTACLLAILLRDFHGSRKICRCLQPSCHGTLSRSSQSAEGHAVGALPQRAPLPYRTRLLAFKNLFGLHDGLDA